MLDALTTVLTIKKPDPFYIIVNSEPEKQIQVLEALMESKNTIIQQVEITVQSNISN